MTSFFYSVLIRRDFHRGVHHLYVLWPGLLQPLIIFITSILVQCYLWWWVIQDSWSLNSNTGWGLFVNAITKVLAGLTLRQNFRMCFTRHCAWSSSSCFVVAIRVVSSAYRRFQMLFRSTSTIHIIMSPQRLNNIGDKMHPCRTPFPISKCSVCSFPTLNFPLALSHRPLINE